MSHAGFNYTPKNSMQLTPAQIELRVLNHFPLEEGQARCRTAAGIAGEIFRGVGDASANHEAVLVALEALAVRGTLRRSEKRVAGVTIALFSLHGAVPNPIG
jgi:hypothetical protein